MPLSGCFFEDAANNIPGVTQDMYDPSQAACRERAANKKSYYSMNNWKQYKRKGVSEMMEWTPEVDMSRVSVSQADKENGSPKPGDMIARNPKDHTDQWLVAKKYFEENLEPV